MLTYTMMTDRGEKKIGTCTFCANLGDVVEKFKEEKDARYVNVQVLDEKGDTVMSFSL